MATHGGPNIVDDGLVFYIDPANTDSWSGPDASLVNSLTSNLTGSIVNDTSGSYGDNNSFAFDGTDDKITFDPIALTTDCSLSAWAKRGSTANMFLLGNTTNYGYGVYFNGTANLYVKGSGAGLTTFNNTAIQTALARTDWVHWLYIKNGTAGTTSVYVDGNLAQSVSHTNPINEISSIGGSGLSTGTQYIWNGSVGPTQVYNKALSAQEVKQNFNALNRFGI